VNMTEDIQIDVKILDADTIDIACTMADKSGRPIKTHISEHLAVVAKVRQVTDGESGFSERDLDERPQRWRKEVEKEASTCIAGKTTEVEPEPERS